MADDPKDIMLKAVEQRKRGLTPEQRARLELVNARAKAIQEAPLKAMTYGGKKDK